MKRLLSRLQLGLVLGVVLPISAFAQNTDSIESYSTRPQIRMVKGALHPELGKSWNLLKRGHVEAAAMLLEMYPGWEIYFLARDAEYLYDTAVLATGGDSALQKRLHLLNVSRGNMRDAGIKPYLRQEGIDEKTLVNKTKVLFVDTGFSGTIPRVLRELFPAQFHSQLQTHLLVSANSEHPSTRVFLTSINTAAPSLNPGSMHGSIVNYEHIGHYTNRSHTFSELAGRWQAISNINISAEGDKDQAGSVLRMEDLRAYLESPEGRLLLEERRRVWHDLRELYTNKKEVELKDALEKLRASKSPYDRAQAIDFIEVIKVNNPMGLDYPLPAIALPVPMQAASSNKVYSNKTKLISEYPEWAPILENPETEIPKLIEKDDFVTLAAIADAVQDVEIWEIIAKSLGINIKKPLARALIRKLFNKGNEELSEALVGTLHGHYKELKNDIRQITDTLTSQAATGSAAAAAKILDSIFGSSEAAEIEDTLVYALEQWVERSGLSPGRLLSIFEQHHSEKLMIAFRRALELCREPQGKESSDDKITETARLLAVGFLKKEFTYNPELVRLAFDLISSDRYLPAFKTLMANLFSSSYLPEPPLPFEVVLESIRSVSRIQWDYFVNHGAWNHIDGVPMVLPFQYLLSRASGYTLKQRRDFYQTIMGNLYNMQWLSSSLGFTEFVIRSLGITTLPGNFHLLYSDQEWEIGSEWLREKLIPEITADKAKVLARQARRDFIPGDFPNHQVNASYPKWDPLRKEGEPAENHRVTSTRPNYKALGPDLKNGEVIRTCGGRKLQVIDKAGSGTRGIVYLVQDRDTKELLALKVAKDSSAEVMESFSKEPQRSKDVAATAAAVPELVEAHYRYVLERWIDGVRGDSWAQKWIDEGMSETSQPYVALKKLVQTLIDHGDYIADLKPENTIWDSKKWVIVDSGRVRRQISQPVVLRKYFKKIPPRWGQGNLACKDMLEKIFDAEAVALSAR